MIIYSFFLSYIYMMACILTCGYRRHGKDTLCQQLQGISLKPMTSWVLYRSPDCTLEFPSVKKDYSRISFAGILKEEVLSSLTLPPEFDPERDKDVPLFSGQSFRSLCIERAMKKREEDPDYWCRLAFERGPSEQDWIVTDWRFLNELGSSNRAEITIRVFSGDSQIPSRDEITEHQLDHVKTDFLLMWASTPFETCVQLFPQYACYQKYDLV